MVRKWSYEDRVILCLLKRFFTREQITPIFNFLSIRDVTHDRRRELTTGALYTQLRDMRMGKEGFKIFYKIESLSDRTLRQRYYVQIRQLEDAADKIGYEQHTSISSNHIRASKNFNLSRRPRRRPFRRPPSTAETLLTEATASSSEEEYIAPRLNLQQFLYDREATYSPAKKISQRPVENFREQLALLPLEPQSHITYNSKNETIRSHPLLLFRATPVLTSYRARKFKDPSISIEAPPPSESAEWRSMVHCHLQRDKKYSSPLISLTQKCGDALGRVETMRSEDITEKVFLIIFSFNDIQSDAEARFGVDTIPYLARSIFAPGEISLLPKSYRGTSEWLAYGSITCDPIAVLDGGQAVTLARSLTFLKNGHEHAIIDIARCLSSVPEIWREAVAHQFLCARCGRTAFAKKGSPSYERFMRQLYCESVNLKDATIPRAPGGSVVSTASRCLSLEIPKNYENGETEEEQSTESQTSDYSVISLPKRQLIIRVPDDQQDNSRPREPQRSKAVNTLNSIAWTTVTNNSVLPKKKTSTRGWANVYEPSKTVDCTNTSHLGTSRVSETPLWSDSSEDEDNYRKMRASPTPLSKPFHGTTASVRLLHTQAKTLNCTIDSASKDYDFVQADLEQSFTENVSPAARKAQRMDEYSQSEASTKTIQSQQIIPSIETDGVIDGLEICGQELLANAFAPTPTPVPVASPPSVLSLTTSSNTQRDGITILSNSERGMHIDLTIGHREAPQIDLSSSGDAVDLTEGTDADDQDKDPLPNGFNRRFRVRLPLRSHSIREQSIICID